jgi:putative aldouronate transport system substrate-binding protein
MRKGIKLLLSCTLVVTMASGCSSGKNDASKDTANGKATSNFNATGYPIAQQKVTMKMMGLKGPIQGPWDQLYFFKEMEDKTNIHFEFDTPPSDSYTEKKNLAFAGGNYPDVFFGGALTAMDEVNYGKQGILIPLEDLIQKYAPTITKYFDEHPDVKRSVTAPDGHIYALPMIMDELRGRVPKLWANATWLDQMVKKDIPTTTDEFHAFLKEMKSTDFNGNGQADEIPLSAQNYGGLRAIMLSYFGHVDTGIEVKNDKAAYVPFEKGYKEYLQFMNKLYSEKLLDNDIFSQKKEQFTAKGKNNQLGVFYQALPMLAMDIKNPEDNSKFPVIPSLTSSVNSEKMYPIDNPVIRGTFSLTDKNQNKEAMIRWVDYLYTDEGSRLAYWGKEGTHYVWLDEQHTKWKVNESQIPQGMNTEEYRAGKITPDAGSKLPIIKSREFDGKREDIANRYAEKKSEEFLPFAKPRFPLVYFTDAEQKQVTAIQTDLNTYVDQMEAQFITGAAGFDKWDEYMSTLKKLKSEDLLKINQSAYDRWKQGK